MFSPNMINFPRTVILLKKKLVWGFPKHALKPWVHLDVLLQGREIFFFNIFLKKKSTSSVVCLYFSTKIETKNN